MARQISWRGVLSPDAPGDGRAQRVDWRPSEPLQPPRSTVDAARLMQFGALLCVLEVPRALLTRDALRRAYEGQVRQDGFSASSADLDRLVALSLSITVIVAVGSAVVWFLMSRATLRGSRWARWGACALFVLALVVFFGGLLPTAGLFARVFAVALLVIGAWALVRLWHRDSSAWIRYHSRPED
jgi:hypothetical protein